MPAPDLPPLRIGAVLLAAGSASRMGHRPKCLLERDGQPLIRRQVLALATAGVSPIVVVLGHYRERIGAALDGLVAQRVINPDPEAPQSASLHRGLNALPESLDAVIVGLADLPLIDHTDIEALTSAWRQRPAGSSFVRPWVDGQPGNPVLFDASVRRDLLAAGPSAGGQQWAATHPRAVYRWVTENRHYITDIDSPQDLDALAAQGVQLHWPGELAD